MSYFSEIFLKPFFSRSGPLDMKIQVLAWKLRRTLFEKCIGFFQEYLFSRFFHDLFYFFERAKFSYERKSFVELKELRWWRFDELLQKKRDCLYSSAFYQWISVKELNAKQNGGLNFFSNCIHYKFWHHVANQILVVYFGWNASRCLDLIFEDKKKFISSSGDLRENWW